MFFTFWHLSFCFFRTRTRTTRLMWTSSLWNNDWWVCFVFPRRKIPSLQGSLIGSNRMVTMRRWVQDVTMNEAIELESSAGRFEWAKEIQFIPPQKTKSVTRDFDRFLDVKIVFTCELELKHRFLSYTFLVSPWTISFGSLCIWL